jgi:predicted ATPase
MVLEIDDHDGPPLCLLRAEISGARRAGASGEGMTMRAKTRLRAPYLKSVRLIEDKIADGWPFDLPILKDPDFALAFDRPVTFFVGENGSGKSTILEAVAAQCGFAAGGGSAAHRNLAPEAASRLAGALRLAWLPRVTNGFYFRGEASLHLSAYLDTEGAARGTALRAESHGEAFLSLVADRMSPSAPSLYLLDEPETALSPARQLSFLADIHRWHRSGFVQAIIATHSPILMAYPNAALLGFDDGRIRPVEFEETEHYRVTKAFLNDRQRFFGELFDEEPADQPHGR